MQTIERFSLRIAEKQSRHLTQQGLMLKELCVLPGDSAIKILMARQLQIPMEGSPVSVRIQLATTMVIPNPLSRRCQRQESMNEVMAVGVVELELELQDWAL